MRYEDFQKINHQQNSWAKLAMSDEELESVGDFDIQRDTSLQNREVDL